MSQTTNDIVDEEEKHQDHSIQYEDAPNPAPSNDPIVSIPSSFQEMLQNRKGNIEKMKARAENGNVLAQTTLAIWYYDGVCVEKDLEQCFIWNEKAVNNSNRLTDNECKVATYNLGWLYYNGEGVAQNKAEGIKLFRKAGEMGYKKGGILAEELPS